MIMKKCPYCLADNDEAAIVCPYCNGNLMVTVPIRVVSRQDVREKANKRSRLIARIIVGFCIMFLITSFAVILILLWNSYLLASPQGTFPRGQLMIALWKEVLHNGSTWILMSINCVELWDKLWCLCESGLREHKTPPDRSGGVRLSGRRDSNPGPLAPKASALAGLRYAPKSSFAPH